MRSRAVALALARLALIASIASAVTARERMVDEGDCDARGAPGRRPGAGFLDDSTTNARSSAKDGIALDETHV